jgi:hypothetical protein
MTAGNGIIHAELPNEQSTSHTLQLWLNLPSDKKMIESDYQDLLASNTLRLDDDRATIRLLSGAVEGVQAATRNHTPVQYLDIRLEAGGRTSLPIPAAHNGFIYVVDGSARLGSERVLGTAGQVVWLDYPTAATGTSVLDIQAEIPSRCLVVTGTPIREPVVAYGPFVMNTEDEIIEAYRDFHSGKFGGPTPAGLRGRTPR